MEGIVIDRAAVEIQDRFVDFLSSYIDYESGEEPHKEDSGSACYLRQVDQMVKRESTSLFVDFQHLLDYDPDLADQIEDEFYR